MLTQRTGEPAVRLYFSVCALSGMCSLAGMLCYSGCEEHGVGLVWYRKVWLISAHR